ncbi:MAG: HAMP domain-containing sensor histidine kinase [Dehalococcoidia bacterium]
MFRSLRFRLVASFALIVLVTLFAAAVALFARLGSYRDDLTETTLRQVASPIYYNLTLFSAQPGVPAPARQLRSELTQYLELQRENSGVIVLLIDANGRVIPESTTDAALLDERFGVPAAPQLGPQFEELALNRHTTSDGQDLVYVTVPTTRAVRALPGGIASIVIAMPETSRRDVWGDLLPRLTFAAIVGGLAAVVVGGVLLGSLYPPLRKVTGGIRAVAGGDYRQRVPVEGPSEVRTLAADVNRMADSVEASQRTLRDFLANVSHELKTPLTSIRGFSQAMLDGTLESPDERARAARVIDAESRRVLHLVEELLDLSRIQSGQQRMELAEVRLPELLAHVGDVFARRAEEAGVTLAVAAAPLAATCTADFDRIEQVLGNLFDNAFRHTPRGGRIEAGARAGAAAFVELYVSDDGEGIPADDLPHVFDRFYRGEGAEAAQPGSGLGLAISREIVRAHGGEISAEARPGGGTTFRFTLPGTMGAHAAAPDSTERPRPGPMRDRPVEG